MLKSGSVVYEAKQDFSSMAYDKSQNYNSQVAMFLMVHYFQANSNVANHFQGSAYSQMQVQPQQVFSSKWS